MQDEKSTSKMSFGNAIFVALVLVSHITEITDTVCGHIEHATVLFDTDLRKFELAIRTENPEWYRKGIQFLAFTRNGKRFEKRDISWGIERDSETLDRQTVVDAAILACNTWSARARLRIRGPVQQPDIRIRFERFNPNLTPEGEIRTISIDFLTQGEILDRHGTRITINDNVNWTHVNIQDWRNIEHALLRGIGHSLGLGDSERYWAQMCLRNLWDRLATWPLHQDDIDGIQDIYGPPGWVNEIRSSSGSDFDRERG